MRKRFLSLLLVLACVLTLAVVPVIAAESEPVQPSAAATEPAAPTEPTAPTAPTEPTVPTTPTQPAEPSPEPTPTGPWYQAAMDFARDHGILVGDASGDMLPGNNAPRAQMAAMLVRVFGCTAGKDITHFSDVDTAAWYYPELSAAAQMNIFSGCGDGTMGPDRNINRQEAMSVIARAFAVADGTAADIAAFSDASAVSDWAIASVAGLVKAGIVSGDAGRLNPTAGITRAEIAQMLYELGLQFCSDAAALPASGRVVYTGTQPLTAGTFTGTLYLGGAAEVKRTGEGARRQGLRAGVDDAAGGRKRGGIGAELQAELIEHLRDLGAGDAGRGVQAAGVTADDAGLDQTGHRGDCPVADGGSVRERGNIGGRAVRHGESAGDDGHGLLTVDIAVRAHGAVTTAAEDVHLRGGAQLRIVPGGSINIRKMRNILARRAAEYAHEHGGHLGARGVVARQHVAARVTDQNAVIAGKVHRRLIPRASRCGLRAGFGGLCGSGRYRRLGGSSRCSRLGGGGGLRRGGRGLYRLRLCGDDRHDGQRQHAREHKQQGQKAFAHGFLLHIFL